MTSSIDAFGISDHYHDIFGERRETSAATRSALRAAMGGGEASAAPTDARVVRLGSGERIEPGGVLELEGGGEVHLQPGPLPPDLPAGYHRLQPPDAPAHPLIVAPPRCWLPEPLSSWGLAAQLYSLRSQESWGMGDLADLRALADWAGQLGASFLLINPLHAVAPVPHQEASPYYPSSRCYRNPLYLRIERVPGAAELLAPELPGLMAAGRALNASDRIDRDEVYRLKMEALSRIWEGFGSSSRFDRFRTEQGEALVSFARYCALTEKHGSDWRRWPVELRHPRSPRVAEEAAELGRRVGFFAWLQWLLDEQMAWASDDIALIQDLPIGVDPGGADAWQFQDVLAQGVSVGAPPDRYSADGQNWGLPPLVPHKLRAAGYEPFARTLRASLRHAEGLRIDHVMGLFRLFWIPQGASAHEGAYVYYPAEDLLAITALESQRARAVIIGEDLGTVEPGTREQMAAHAILSYRLLWFEEQSPESYPELALSAITTHDLPTVTGLWTGSDVEEQRQLGLKVNEEELGRVRERLIGMTGLSSSAELAEVIEATHRLLAQSPSRLLTATLEDLVGSQRRPNLPATTCDRRPNWSIPLPASLEELTRSPLARAVAAALARPAV